MITERELADKFEAIFTSSFSEKDVNVAGEIVRILVKTEWVTVFVISQIEIQENVTVEVEVSVPRKVAQVENTKAAIDVIESMILHLEYVKGLINIGFDLSIILEDGLWVSSMSICSLPNLQLFETLLPPTSS